MKVYKIRNKETGLFKKGGGGGPNNDWARWSKTGKSWSSLGGLKNHMRLNYWETRTVVKDSLIEWYLKRYPTHEILEITIEETNTKVLT